MCGASSGRSRGTSRSSKSWGVGPRSVPITVFGSRILYRALNSDVIVLVVGSWATCIWGICLRNECEWCAYDGLVWKNIQRGGEMYESHFFERV